MNNYTIYWMFYVNIIEFLVATIVYINSTVCTVMEGKLCPDRLLLLVGSHVHSFCLRSRQVRNIRQGWLLLPASVLIVLTPSKLLCPVCSIINTCILWALAGTKLHVELEQLHWTSCEMCLVAMLDHFFGSFFLPFNPPGLFLEMSSTYCR